MLVGSFALAMIMQLAGTPQNSARPALCQSRFAPLIEPLKPSFRNDVQVDRSGKLYWNGTEVVAEQLEFYIVQTGKMKPLPSFVVSWADGTDCANVTRLENIVQATGICQRTKCAVQSNSGEIMQNRPPPPPPVK